MYTDLHIHEPTIRAKRSRYQAEARIATQLRTARSEHTGRFSTVTTGLRRSISTVLIATGERLQPTEPGVHPEKPADTVMQA